MKTTLTMLFHVSFCDAAMAVTSLC
jgi:hypothetical protein